MPTSCLLAHNTVSSLQPLRYGFTNIVVDLIGQRSLVAFPTIGTPFEAVSLALSTSY